MTAFFFRQQARKSRALSLIADTAGRRAGIAQ
jgi:hypothetical protein